MSALPAAFNFAQHMVPFSLHLPTFTPELEQGAEFASAYALGALGQILMPFVEEPKPYIPAQAVTADKGKVRHAMQACHAFHLCCQDVPCLI